MMQAVAQRRTGLMIMAGDQYRYQSTGGNQRNYCADPHHSLLHGPCSEKGTRDIGGILACAGFA